MVVQIGEAEGCVVLNGEGLLWLAAVAEAGQVEHQASVALAAERKRQRPQQVNAGAPPMRQQHGRALTDDLLTDSDALD